MTFADTPRPPYYTVIFTSLRTPGEHGYGAMAARMEELAEKQPGYLGIESVREGLGITVSRDCRNRGKDHRYCCDLLLLRSSSIKRKTASIRASRG